MEPVRVALVGAGRRGRSIYFPVLRALKAWVEVVAVCDRQPDLTRSGSGAFGVPGYTSLKDLVRDRPMEACIVVTPPHSHHAISCYLSAHGVHHLVETPICDSLVQARAMVAAAERTGIVFRVGEQFFRDKIDALARQLIAAGVIGQVGRITNYHTHLGYHNNSRHQVIAGAAPIAVNAISHTMAVSPYVNTERPFDREVFTNISFHFENGLLITDLAGNIKGALGRYSRPGLVEIDGAAGAIIQQAPDHWRGRAEVRLVAPEELARGGYSRSYPILFEYRTPEGRIIDTPELIKRQTVVEGAFTGVRVDLPQGTFRVENEFLALGLETVYHPEVAEAVRDFACLIRRGAPDPFTPEMAVTSLGMSHAAALSARRQGARVDLPAADADELDEGILNSLRRQFGVDPLDVEAMVDISFPKP